MENLNSSYETIFIVDLQIGDEAVKTTVEKFLSLIRENGEITQINEWGKRRLAYPINDLNEGYYVLVNFNAPADFPLELERVYNITEAIMRSLVVKIEIKKKKSVDAVKPAQPQAAEIETTEETLSDEIIGESSETAETAE